MRRSAGLHQCMSLTASRWPCYHKAAIAINRMPQCERIERWNACLVISLGDPCGMVISVLSDVNSKPQRQKGRGTRNLHEIAWREITMSAANTMHSDREVLSLAERVAEPIFSLIATCLLLAFFAYHQLTATGFFTAQFGPFEMLCLYGPILLAPAAAFTRAMSGQRNPARPVEAFANLCMALAAIWLLRVFPFNFIGCPASCHTVHASMGHQRHRQAHPHVTSGGRNASCAHHPAAILCSTRTRVTRDRTLEGVQQSSETFAAGTASLTFSQVSVAGG
jgi:hypothetical protein